nr:hypothetical protein [bacterium]
MTKKSAWAIAAVCAMCLCVIALPAFLFSADPWQSAPDYTIPSLPPFQTPQGVSPTPTPQGGQPTPTPLWTQAPTTPLATPSPTPSPTPEVTAQATPAQQQYTYNAYALHGYMHQALEGCDALEAWPSFVDAISRHDVRYDYGAQGISEHAARIMVELFRQEHPLNAFLTDAVVDGQEGMIYLDYRYSKGVQQINLGRFISRVDQALAACAPPEADPLDIMLALHLYVARAGQYNAKAAHTDCYGLLVNGTAVCYGFTDTLRFLLLQCGIESDKLLGQTVKGEAHGWNLVEIDGEYYHLDPTWERSANRGTGLAMFGLTDAARSVRLVLPATRVGYPENTVQPPCTSERFAQLQLLAARCTVVPEHHAVYFTSRVDGLNYVYNTRTGSIIPF